MLAQLLLLPTLVAAGSFVTDSKDINPSGSVAIEKPSQLSVQDTVTQAPGIVVTITGVEGAAFTTTFAPLIPLSPPPQDMTLTVASYESNANSEKIVLTGSSNHTEATGTTEVASVTAAKTTEPVQTTAVASLLESSSNPAASPTAMMSHAFAGVVAIVGLLILV